jgi:flagellin-specific chaperone FliS
MADVSSQLARATAAYRASQQLDPRPGALLASVHDRLRLSLASAISAYEAGALDQMCRHNERSTQLLNALQAALNPAAAELEGLLAFYRRTQFVLNRMLSNADAINTARFCLSHLNSMSREFQRYMK